MQLNLNWDDFDSGYLPVQTKAKRALANPINQFWYSLLVNKKLLNPVKTIIPPQPFPKLSPNPTLKSNPVVIPVKCLGDKMHRPNSILWKYDPLRFLTEKKNYREKLRMFELNKHNSQ